MSVAIYDATAGAVVQQIRMEIIANNLANVNTPGFKEDKAVFRAYLPEKTSVNPTDGMVIGEPPPGETNPDDPIGDQVMVEDPDMVSQISEPLPGDYSIACDGVATNFRGGILAKTGNPLNFALEGNGFFCIKTQAGTEYTRNGSLTINNDGLLSTHDGLPVLGTNGTIRIDEERFIVDAEGYIFTVENEGGEYIADNSVGQLKIVDFGEPYPLKKVGNGRFELTNVEIAEKKAENCEVIQGYLESSNVNPVLTMTEMIDVLRTYEAYQKVIQAFDEINDKSTTDIAKIA